MRQYHNFIKIDGAGFLGGDGTIQDISTVGAAAYEHRMIGLLSAIEQNPAGQILFHELRAAKGAHSIQIYRYYQTAKDEKKANAFSLATNMRAATPKMKNVRDSWGNPVLEPVLDAKGDPLVDTVTLQVATRPVLGTGGGSDVMLGFTPEMFSHSELAGMAPDEVLFHELTHSYRELRGNFQRVRMGTARPATLPNGNKTPGFPMRTTDGQDIVWTEFYDNQEEFLATTLTNVYISAKGPGRRLRGHYLMRTNKQHILQGVAFKDSASRNRSGALQAGSTISEAFALEFLGVIAQLYCEEKPLASAMAKVNCTFNPFRDYQLMESKAHHRHGKVRSIHMSKTLAAP